MKDPYYSQPEVSNSDLSWLKNQFESVSYRGEVEKAYKFGTLIDCMITEPDKVNYFTRECSGTVHSYDEFEQAQEMKKAFYKNEMCRIMASQAKYQAIMRRRMSIVHDGFEFELPVRCKWDLWIGNHAVNGDIKSTAAETQRQFEEAVRYFEYHRQRAWYMDIAQSDRDVLIGISKKNYKIFMVPITRGSELYKLGKARYSELAFKWHYLFSDF